MWDAVSTLWAEPAAQDPPPRGWRDALLAGAVVAASVGEALVRPDLTWRPAAVGVGVALGAALLRRRTSPLGAVALGFGAFAAADVAAAVAGAAPIVLYAGVAVLVLAYALLRWGSGRDIAVGLAVVTAAFAVAVVTDDTGASDAVGGAAVLLLAAALGASLRYRATARDQLVARARVEERGQLARELHDTVAHHVSAIAVQAQAGLALARSRPPDAATEALEAIDREAARTLAEMRTMVGALRDARHAPDLTPAPGIAAVEGLAAGGGAAPRVEVELRGDLADLPPSVAAAIYRVAQESVTNARRHAQRASRVEVTVTGTASEVRVTVLDDGVSGVGGPGQPGYGLVGMTERVTLLGGTLTAGPGEGCGWAVRAVLPRTGTPR